MTSYFLTFFFSDFKKSSKKILAGNRIFSFTSVFLQHRDLFFRHKGTTQKNAFLHIHFDFSHIGWKEKKLNYYKRKKKHTHIIIKNIYNFGWLLLLFIIIYILYFIYNNKQHQIKKYLYFFYEVYPHTHTYPHIIKK